MDIQLEEEMYINDHSRNKSRTTIQHYSNYNELRYNVHIYKKDKEIFNIYSSK